MTTGERLAQISGLAGVSAAVMLLAVGSGANAGAALVNYSGLPTGTAAQHLLVDRAAAEEGSHGGNVYAFPKPRRRREEDEAILITLM